MALQPAVAPPDPYRLLGLKHGASADEVKSAHRKLARQFHPDVNPEGAAKMAALNAARDAILEGRPFGKQLSDVLNDLRGGIFTTTPEREAAYRRELHEKWAKQDGISVEELERRQAEEQRWRERSDRIESFLEEARRALREPKDRHGIRMGWTDRTARNRAEKVVSLMQRVLAELPAAKGKVRVRTDGGKVRVRYR